MFVSCCQHYLQVDPTLKQTDKQVALTFVTFAEAGTHGLSTAGCFICSPWWLKDEEDEEQVKERKKGKKKRQQ